MNLFHQFALCAPNRVFLATLLSVLAGVCYTLLIPTVLSAISEDLAGLSGTEAHIVRIMMLDVSHARFAAFFFGLCVVILLARTISQLILVAVSINYTADLRTHLYRRILRAAVPTIDQMGYSKLNVALTEDVRRVVWGARLLPDVLVNFVTVLGMLSFLLYLNTDSFWFVLKVLVFGVVTYQIPVWFAHRQFNISNDLTGRLHEAIRGLVLGIKELKLDRDKRNAYYTEVLYSGEMELANSDKRAFITMALANNYGDLISFFVIGTIAFIFVNYHSLSATELVGVVMVLLYLAAPVAGILAVMPQIAMGKVSLKRIDELVASLTMETANEQIQPIANWNTLSFEDVHFRYEGAENDRHFAIGPLNFRIGRGQVTFIVGGNGSGKSTLAKLISLHYRAHSGSIAFDGVPVNDDTLESLRQEIACIYSDYYLFDRLLVDTGPDILEEADRLLKALGLNEKVSIENGRFSTLALSDGQKRRVALLVSFLENKRLYVFDEWAADQDPAFKEVFYQQILPELKARGKCIVVISHDDRYFSAADQVLVMESGRLIADLPGGRGINLSRIFLEANGAKPIVTAA